MDHISFPVGSGDLNEHITAVLAFGFLSISLLMNTIANFFFLRRIPPLDGEVAESVAVIVPMRNESANVQSLIESLKSQIGLRKINFIIVDDNSTDDTFTKVHALVGKDDRFQLIQAPPLENGWMGKPATMQHGIKSSASEIVVFIDADVSLGKDAIARAVRTLINLHLDYISAYPKQGARTWSECLIQPLLQWSWMATVPLRLSEKSRNPAFCVANGQFFVVQRVALENIDNLQRIRSAVLDDIYLARELVRSGYHGTVVDGSAIATCRMYSSWKELREGYGKSLHIAFGSRAGAAAAVMFFFFAGPLPLLFALAGSKIALSAFVAIIFTRVISARSSEGNVWLSLLHPFSMLLVSYLLVRSWVYRNTVIWKGRTL